MNPQMRFQREADRAWAHQLRELPGCERIYSCMQCGTCSGTCPLSIYMEYTPRQVINLAREGFKLDVLSSNTIWLCASCYSCTVHCPQDVHITDVMYSLKRQAIREKLYPKQFPIPVHPKRFPIPVLAQEFYRVVKAHGRSSELWVALRMALRSNPSILPAMFKASLQLVRTGRLSLRMERIKRIDELRRALDAHQRAD